MHVQREIRHKDRDSEFFIFSISRYIYLFNDVLSFLIYITGFVFDANVNAFWRNINKVPALIALNIAIMHFLIDFF